MKNPAMDNVVSQGHVESKATYETPKVITFGTVAKLTMGGGATTTDGKGTHRKG